MKPSLKTARARTEVKNFRANIGFKEWKKASLHSSVTQQLVEAFVPTGREKKSNGSKNH